MNFFKLVILGAVGVIAFAVIYDENQGIRLPGINLGGPSVPGTPGSAPRSNSPSAPAGKAPSESGTFSSFLNLLKSKATAATSSLSAHSRSDLRIARGLVVDQTGSGVVLTCSRWVVQGLSGGVYAGDGRGMNPIGANLVDAHEKLQYGWLMSVDAGVLRQSVYETNLWTPYSYLEGTYMVRGLPATISTPRGKGIKFVVVPDGNALWQGNMIPACTVNFTLSD
jgi:hypothetical protein